MYWSELETLQQKIIIAIFISLAMSIFFKEFLIVLTVLIILLIISYLLFYKGIWKQKIDTAIIILVILSIIFKEFLIVLLVVLLVVLLIFYTLFYSFENMFKSIYNFFFEEFEEKDTKTYYDKPKRKTNKYYSDKKFDYDLELENRLNRLNYDIFTKTDETELFTTTYEQNLENYGIDYIYHMTHINNIHNILGYGLLSHNNNKVNSTIDNPEVNGKRNFLEPIYNKNVHNYVPFYFNPKNAMLYVNKNIQDNIIILVFDATLIYQNGSLFTDGNASVRGTKFFNNLNDLNKLDWKCLKSQYWNDFVDGKRKMMAEVLVPNKVKIDKLQKIYCNNYYTKNRIELILEIELMDIEVEINENIFFKG